uniref:Mitochondrial import inner membrane translocase subunit n=1 Tax=Toxoplasma gondii (strain ATCC 50861 / VEG) TaxID=432359 RepID=A0A0F7V6I7_TOXGV|nr:TPA: Mitochondrial import inner membrane translocase subunit TIM10 [Toxoplasma gondii VEG]
MFGSSENSSLSSGEGASGFSGQGDSGVEAQQLQVHKTCFKKCFPSNKFYSELSKSDHVCLAKCMDRMYEANEIVHQATVEMRQNFPPSGTGL